MMSDSDDTDVLLLIPPDLFLVPSSSESDISSDRMKTNYSSKKTGVISELVEHMQSLESRIFAIESKDTSLDVTFLNNSLDSQIENNSIAKFRQTLPKTKLSVSENCSLQNTPIKPRQSLSVPSTPNGNSLPNHINFCQNDINLGNHLFVSTATNVTNANKHDENKHGTLISQSSVVVSSACNVGFPHVNVTSSGGKTYSHPVNCRNTDNIYVKPSVNQLRSIPSTSTLPSTTEQPQSSSKTNIPEMELSEVDELLQEMEATELELSKRINRVSMHHCLKEQNNILTNDSNDNFKKGYNNMYKNSVNRRLEFKSQDSNECHDVLSVKSNKKSDILADISLPYCDSFHINETDKMISEFKTWEQSIQSQVSKIGEVEHTDTNSSSIDKSIAKANDVQNKEIVTQQIPLSIDNVNNMNSVNMNNIEIRNVHKKIDTSLHDESTQCNTATSTKSTEYNVLHLPEPYKSLQQNGNLEHNIKQTCDVPLVRNIAHASTNTDFLSRRTLANPRLLSLSDFWENNGNKTQEEIHRIKLEEEKFRREHCEHLIQELQKRLLEQQEKVAVALRVDNEKNELITQFHNAWSKLKQRMNILENEYSALQTNFKNVTEKHQLEISEFQLQIKRCEGELSKALDLAAGYKEKNDIAMKEKVELLKNHADELENYKSFVQEAENRYEKLKIEYDKLLEKNQQSEETLKTLQQELGKERLKGGEVRNEMDVIHKALDTCEAELIVLRQEKENLQLKLREENGRNSILEQKNAALLSTLDDVKKAEKLARDETRFLAEQKEKIRCELQEIYQKQVDEVVKVKLQEFQTQLDVAESEFLEELKTRQQVIAECAARKIKDIIDKHKLEINLLEEKHKEEKRLCELQLAEALQKSSFLESQLNSQRATKSQLAEQLHSVMQNQWQQALQIISGGNMENLTPLQKIHAEKLFELRSPKKSESMPNCYTKISQEPIKLTSHVSDMRKFCDQNECMNTSIDETPLSSRKESKDDLRKYVKMIAEMQKANEEFSKITGSISSPSLTCREVPRKHYFKGKECDIRDENHIEWQSVSKETSEFIPISQKISIKGEQQKIKPPWK